MPMSPEERRAFDRAVATIKSQQTQLEALAAPSYPIGTIIGVLEKSLVYDLNNGVFEAERPAGTDQSWLGYTVKIHPKTGQVVTASKYVRYGATATIAQLSGKMAILNVNQGSFVTEQSQVPFETLAIGDTVVLDYTNKVILRHIESKSKYGYQTQSPLEWSDIGGCVEAKAELRKELELPYSNLDVFQFFNKKRVKGGLLFGRPGMGKTLLGRACAGAIARAHGKEGVDTGFLYVKGPELLSKWIGETEQGVRSLFDHSRLHFKKYGYPAVIFIDEADAILIRRGMRTTSGMEQTVVPMFNAEMDGMEESGAFVLLATNRADILDPAITRPGRCDRKFYIAAPTKESSPEIFNIHMRTVPIAPKYSKDQLIECANLSLWGDRFPLYKLETDKGTKPFGLAQLSSGAMIAGLVERAISMAIDRNLGVKKPDGVTQGDFDNALIATHREQFGLNHYDELKEFITTEKLEVTAITPCHTVEELAKETPKPQPETRAIAVAVPTGGKQKFDA